MNLLGKSSKFAPRRSGRSGDVRDEVEIKLAEALAAKERAEAERDTLEKRCDGLRSTLFDADAEAARLTAALAGAREVIAAFMHAAWTEPRMSGEVSLKGWNNSRLTRAYEMVRALPTTEPAKAEEGKASFPSREAQQRSVDAWQKLEAERASPTTEPAKAEERDV